MTNAGGNHHVADPPQLAVDGEIETRTPAPAARSRPAPSVSTPSPIAHIHQREVKRAGVPDSARSARRTPASATGTRVIQMSMKMRRANITRRGSRRRGRPPPTSPANRASRLVVGRSVAIRCQDERAGDDDQRAERDRKALQRRPRRRTAGRRPATIQ